MDDKVRKVMVRLASSMTENVRQALEEARAQCTPIEGLQKDHVFAVGFVITHVLSGYLRLIGGQNRKELQDLILKELIDDSRLEDIDLTNIKTEVH